MKPNHLTIVFVVSMLGCDSASDGPGEASASPIQTATQVASAPVDAPATASAAGTAAPTASASAAPAAEPPLEPSPRPTKEEWDAAPAVDVKPAVASCTLKTIREWARVSCERDYYGIMGTLGLGKLGERHFIGAGTGSGSVEVQAKRGELSAVKLLRDPSNAVLRVGWPSDEPRPTLVAFEDRNAAFEPYSKAEPEASVPAVPGEASARPTSGDWLKARHVDTTGKKRAALCEIAVLRDWVRVRCRDGLGFTAITDLGKLGEDHFAAKVLMESELVARLRKGMQASVTHLNHPASDVIVMTWPSDQDRPTVLGSNPEGFKR